MQLYHAHSGKFRETLLVRAVNTNSICVDSRKPLHKTGNFNIIVSAITTHETSKGHPFCESNIYNIGWPLLPNKRRMQRAGKTGVFFIFA